MFNIAIDIKATNIQVLYVPLYRGLSIENIMEFGMKTDHVRHYLPEERDLHRLPRQFIVNIIFTIVQDPFKLWVKERIKARNDTVAENRSLLISLDPEIAAAFRNSVNISSKSFVFRKHLNMKSSTNISYLCSPER